MGIASSIALPAQSLSDSLYTALSYYENQGQWIQLESEIRSILNSSEVTKSHSDEVKLLGLLGDCNLELGNFDEALPSYRKAEALVQNHLNTDSLLAADLYQKIGNYFLEIMETETAKPYLMMARKIREQFLGTDHVKTADTYNNLGILYFNQGDYTQALAFHEQALQIRSRHLSFNDPLLAQSYNNIGLCHQDATSWSEALTAFEEAIHRYSMYDHTTKELGEVYLNLGTVYNDIDEVDRSLQSYLQALHLFEELGDAALAQKATCLTNLGNLRSDQNAFQDAHDFYLTSLAIRTSLFGHANAEVAECYYNLGFHHQKFGNLDTAIHFLNLGIESLGYSKEDSTRFSHCSAPLTLLRCMFLLAEVTLYKSEEKGDANLLLKSLELYREQDLLIDVLRMRYELDQAKIDLVFYANLIYERAIDLTLNLYENTRELRYWHLAFYFSERSKSIILFDAFQQSSAESFAQVPNEVLDSIHILEKKLATIETRLFLEKEQFDQKETQLERLTKEQFQTQQRLLHSIKKVEARYPEYYQLRYDTYVPSVSRVQQSLDSTSQSVVEYFLGTEQLVIFWISATDFQVIALPLSPNFAAIVDDFVSSIHAFPSIGSTNLEANLSDYVRSAYQLYQMLIGPVAHFVNGPLIVIPDHILHAIPFEALITEDVKSLNQISNYPFLVRKHPIAYNYSTSLLLKSASNRTNQNLKPYLGLAPNFNAQSSELKALKYNAAEIKYAQSVFGGNAFYDDEATKDQFIKHQNHYQILHLATHGKVNPDHEDYSFIAFTPSDHAAKQDDRLYIREIYSLHTRAELVILSACETAQGNLYPGEGLMSIARSFSYAGAKSLLATRWNINDQQANQVISLLADQLSLQNPKSLSLHKAINNYLEVSSQKYAHPFYWAAFMLIGDDIPIESISFFRRHLHWIVLTFALLVMLSFVARRFGYI